MKEITAQVSEDTADRLNNFLTAVDMTVSEAIDDAINESITTYNPQK